MQASVDAQPSFLQDIAGRAETASVSGSRVDRRWQKQPLVGALDF